MLIEFLYNLPKLNTTLGLYMKPNTKHSTSTDAIVVASALPSALPSSVEKAPDLATLSNQQMQQWTWSALNFTTVAAVTSASIVAVQSPVKTIILNITKNGTFVPSFTGGSLGFFSALYKGTSASLSGSAVRTAYVTGAKNNKPIEDSSPGKRLTPAKLRYVMSAALGDIIVTQIPESLSQLQKVKGLLPKDFKWYASGNPYRLMAGGFAPRYCAGLVNFTAMCVLEDKISNALPIENSQTKHFIAGGMSGMMAATCSYPFAVFKDYILVQASVTSDGLLVNKSAVSALKDMAHTLTLNPKEAAKIVLVNAAKQLPMRIALTGAIFSIVAGVGEKLGVEPLACVIPEQYQPLSAARNPQGFFGSLQGRPQIEEVVPAAQPKSPGK